MLLALNSVVFFQTEGLFIFLEKTKQKTSANCQAPSGCPVLLAKSRGQHNSASPQTVLPLIAFWLRCSAWQKAAGAGGTRLVT